MIWVKQPRWSRLAVCFHGFGFAPFYALFCIGFLFRLNWIRVPGIVIGAAKLYAGLVISLFFFICIYIIFLSICKARILYPSTCIYATYRSRSFYRSIYILSVSVYLLYHLRPQLYSLIYPSNFNQSVSYCTHSALYIVYHRVRGAVLELS